jgi:hypothetical protein
MGWRRRHSSIQVDEDLASASAAQSCFSLGRDARKWPVGELTWCPKLAVVKCIAASVRFVQLFCDQNPID